MGIKFRFFLAILMIVSGINFVVEKGSIKKKNCALDVTYARRATALQSLPTRTTDPHGFIPKSPIIQTQMITFRRTWMALYFSLSPAVTNTHPPPTL